MSQPSETRSHANQSGSEGRQKTDTQARLRKLNADSHIVLWKQIAHLAVFVASTTATWYFISAVSGLQPIIAVLLATLPGCVVSSFLLVPWRLSRLLTPNASRHDILRMMRANSPAHCCRPVVAGISLFILVATAGVYQSLSQEWLPGSILLTISIVVGIFAGRGYTYFLRQFVRWSFARALRRLDTSPCKVSQADSIQWNEWADEVMRLNARHPADRRSALEKLTRLDKEPAATQILFLWNDQGPHRLCKSEGFGGPVTSGMATYSCAGAIYLRGGSPV